MCQRCESFTSASVRVVSAPLPLSRRGLLAAGFVGIAAAMIAGCQSTTSTPEQSTRPSSSGEPQAPITNTDPCATRLHDMCGPLLLYYVMRQSLPARLDELSRVPGFESVNNFTCPVSGKPYLYNPIGVQQPSQPSRIIAYDPAPSHSNMRWAISIIEPQDNSPLISKVIALPESFFSLNINPK